MVTWLYLVKSMDISSIGIGQRCMPNLPHHQKPSVPSVRSVAFISYMSAPKASAASYAVRFVYPMREKYTTSRVLSRPMFLYLAVSTVKPSCRMNTYAAQPVHACARPNMKYSVDITFSGNITNCMRIQSMSVTPNTPPSITPALLRAKSSPAAIRLLSPFTISSAMPENTKS